MVISDVFVSHLVTFYHSQSQGTQTEMYDALTQMGGGATELYSKGQGYWKGEDVGRFGNLPPKD